MNSKEALINEIIERELEMFLLVPSRYPAPCQSNPKGFRDARSTQFFVWSEETLTSYLNDLKTAADQDRNLMTLKYARMEGLIPAIHEDPLNRSLIHEIVAVQLEWQKEMIQKYPNLMGRGRPLEDGEGGGGVTSFVTYLQGELETYSGETLTCLHRDIMEAQNRDENLTETIYLHTVRKQGYRSIEDAEARVREGRA